MQSRDRRANAFGLAASLQQVRRGGGAGKWRLSRRRLDAARLVPREACFRVHHARVGYSPPSRIQLFEQRANSRCMLGSQPAGCSVAQLPLGLQGAKTPLASACKPPSNSVERPSVPPTACLRRARSRFAVFRCPGPRRWAGEQRILAARPVSRRARNRGQRGLRGRQRGQREVQEPGGAPAGFRSSCGLGYRQRSSPPRREQRGSKLRSASPLSCWRAHLGVETGGQTPSHSLSTRAQIYGWLAAKVAGLVGRSVSQSSSQRHFAPQTKRHTQP